MDFFYNSICHVCKEYKKGIMKRCGSCRCITYCSKEHQICDWKNHKQICRLLANSNEFFNLTVDCGYHKWRSFRTSLGLYLDQRVCAVCFSRENLKDCESCLCVAYCSKDHQTKHKESHSTVCRNLKLCLDYDRFYVKTNKIEVKLKEIDTDNEKLPNSIQECLEMFVDMSEICDTLLKIYVADIFATMLTIIYSMEKCDILKKRYSKFDNLVVHVVGADISELAADWNSNFLLLKSWIKDLKSCKFIFIGPDCILSERPKHTCNNIKIECVNDFYHNTKNLDEPHLIVALNSGLHEFQSDNKQDTWGKSLVKLISDKAPLVLTAYTRRELEEDVKRLQIFEMKMLLDIQKNPFSNNRPIRDWDSELYTPFYVNGYIAILAGVNYK
ncbi:uncharacterized protein LOC123311239 [Coccinella septempunctata]|uniref:uncharacterized protein LOC123311239 n=1 Tax=Coccinella septempunctata TaxID=41139 RepID=UPI001D064E55|nr:uncharacterized protein LOC123311239 [Coccinella septempunctata]